MTEESQRALDLAHRFWDRLLEFAPLVGTEVGDERFDDRLPDPSEEGLAIQRVAYDEALEELGHIDSEGFDETTRTTLDVLDAICRLQLGSIEHRTDRFYAVSHMFGPGALLADIGALQRADTPERFERFVARLSTPMRSSSTPRWPWNRSTSTTSGRPSWRRSRMSGPRSPRASGTATWSPAWMSTSPVGRTPPRLARR